MSMGLHVFGHTRRHYGLLYNIIHGCEAVRTASNYFHYYTMHIIDLFDLSSSFPHLFPLLCGVDVSYETPPFSPILLCPPLTMITPH